MQLQQVDYAPAPPNQKRRRAIRRVAVGLAALLTAILAIKSAPLAWRHVQILYWQHRAMTYTAPADQVVYDYDPYRYDPKGAVKLRGLNPSLAVETNGDLSDFAEPWDRLYQLMSPPGRKPAATLFLHQRRNSLGQSRLVVLEFRPATGTIIGVVGSQLQQALVRPGTLIRSPIEELTSLPGLPADEERPPIRWYAGQPDPRDESHFTVRGIHRGREVLVDGWLRNETLELSITSPAPSSSAKSPPTAR